MESRGGRDAAASVLAKTLEQIERTRHLLARVPLDAPQWKPPMTTDVLPLDRLVGHLLECAAGFCAVLYAVRPDRLAHFADLRTLPVNQPAAPAEAAGRLAQYAAHIEEGFALLDDADLARRIPTLFVPAGETVLTLLLGNLEHMVNHKFQLFFYLKMQGVPVGTPDLYRLRGPAPASS